MTSLSSRVMSVVRCVGDGSLLCRVCRRWVDVIRFDSGQKPCDAFADGVTFGESSSGSCLEICHFCVYCSDFMLVMVGNRPVTCLPMVRWKKQH